MLWELPVLRLILSPQPAIQHCCEGKVLCTGAFAGLTTAACLATSTMGCSTENLLQKGAKKPWLQHILHRFCSQSIKATTASPSAQRLSDAGPVASGLKPAVTPAGRGTGRPAASAGKPPLSGARTAKSAGRSAARTQYPSQNEDPQEIPGGFTGMRLSSTTVTSRIAPK